MDALEFLVERNRLCGSYRGCVGCPFGKDFEKELETAKQFEPKLYNP